MQVYSGYQIKTEQVTLVLAKYSESYTQSKTRYYTKQYIIIHTVWAIHYTGRVSRCLALLFCSIPTAITYTVNTCSY